MPESDRELEKWKNKRSWGGRKHGKIRRSLEKVMVKGGDNGEGEREKLGQRRVRSKWLKKHQYVALLAGEEK